MKFKWKQLLWWTENETIPTMNIPHFSVHFGSSSFRRFFHSTATDTSTATPLYTHTHTHGDTRTFMIYVQRTERYFSSMAKCYRGAIDTNERKIRIYVEASRNQSDCHEFRVWKHSSICGKMIFVCRYHSQFTLSLNFMRNCYSTSKWMGCDWFALEMLEGAATRYRCFRVTNSRLQRHLVRRRHTSYKQ